MSPTDKRSIRVPPLRPFPTEVATQDSTQKGAARGVIAFLALVFSASIAIVVVLPRSSAAPLVSAFIPVAVLILVTPFEGRTVWTGLGVFQIQSGGRLWPVAIAIPMAVAASSYLVAWRLGMVKPIAVLGISVILLIITASVTAVVVMGRLFGRTTASTADGSPTDRA